MDSKRIRKIISEEIRRALKESAEKDMSQDVLNGKHDPDLKSLLFATEDAYTALYLLGKNRNGPTSWVGREKPELPKRKEMIKQVASKIIEKSSSKPEKSGDKYSDIFASVKSEKSKSLLDFCKKLPLDAAQERLRTFKSDYMNKRITKYAGLAADVLPELQNQLGSETTTDEL